MNTYVANFGRANAIWPDCLRRSTVATFEEEDLRPLWLSGDRRAYIDYCIANKKTAAGNTPTAAVASRWFEIGTIVSTTVGELWLHTDGDDLWWTTTLAGPAQVELMASRWPGRGNAPRVYEIHKPAAPWLRKSKTGIPLRWSGLHPKARDFLVTQGTLAALSEDNAGYVHALIAGEDLTPWHGRSLWRDKQSTAKAVPVTHFSAPDRAVWRMVNVAMETVSKADGRAVQSTVKVKQCGFDTTAEFTRYVKALLEEQDYVCALSGLPLQLDGEHDDVAMLASLDRKDSAGHYESGNLQVVCRFINFWKSDQDNAEFTRLMRIVQERSRAL